MKKHVAFLFLAVLFLGTFAFAQEAVQVVEAPPEWLVKALEFLAKAPIVGPYLAKAAQWFGVVITIITAFTVFMLTSLNALMKVLNVAGLVSLASKIEMFKNSKIMYYMKYASALLNAQKPSVDEKPKA